MNSNRFDEIVLETLDSIRETLVIKGKEYRRNGNPFHNFDEGARMKNIIREKVLDGMLLKHEISISDITNDIEKGILPKIETINEKFGDNLIYLLLKKASIIDRIERGISERDEKKQTDISKYIEGENRLSEKRFSVVSSEF